MLDTKFCHFKLFPYLSVLVAQAMCWGLHRLVGVGWWSESENKANSAQLKLELWLSLAIRISILCQSHMGGYRVRRLSSFLCVVFLGFSRVLHGFHGFSRGFRWISHFFKDFPGFLDFSWVFKLFQGGCRFIQVSLRVLMSFHGFSWVFKGFHGFSRVVRFFC